MHKHQSNKKKGDNSLSIVMVNSAESVEGRERERERERDELTVSGGWWASVEFSLAQTNYLLHVRDVKWSRLFFSVVAIS